MRSATATIRLWGSGIAAFSCAVIHCAPSASAASPSKSTHMAGSRLPRMLEANKEYVAARSAKAFSESSASASARASTPAPSASLQSAKDNLAVIVSCMDARLVELLPRALNIQEGDAKVIKTAGAIITHPFGGIMRSVIVAIYGLGAQEVFVVAHYDCGMSNVDPDVLIGRMQTTGGVKPETLSTLQAAGINVRGWLRGFEDVSVAVRESVSRVRAHPLVPANVPVHGLIIHPLTGQLELVVDGRESVGGGSHVWMAATDQE